MGLIIGYWAYKISNIILGLVGIKGKNILLLTLKIFIYFTEWEWWRQ